MTNEPRSHPDLLRRFVATPFVFNKGEAPGQIHVESNDLEIAMSIRNSGIVQRTGVQTGGLLCRLIRDMTAPLGGSGILILSSGPLRTLYLGIGTILIHDRERSELLGFISSDVKTQELVSSLIPVLLNS
jgi:hypothetical protein